MTRKKINKNKNYTPYYIWGLHASISALNNDNRKIKNIYCSQLVFDKYIDNLVNITSPIKIVKSNDLDSLTCKEEVSQSSEVKDPSLGQFN